MADWTPEDDGDRHLYLSARALRDERPPRDADILTVVSPRHAGRHSFYGVSTAVGGTQGAVIDGYTPTGSAPPRLSVTVFAKGHHKPVVSYPHHSAMPGPDQLLHPGGDVTLTGDWRRLALYSGGLTTLLQEHVYALVATPDGGYSAHDMVVVDPTGRRPALRPPTVHDLHLTVAQQLLPLPLNGFSQRLRHPPRSGAG